MKTPSFFRRLSRGMSLIEMVVVLAVVAIVATFVVPRFSGVATAATESGAITKAEALNNAMFTYRQRISGAQTNWTGAANDEARYTLLLNAGYLPNASATLALFTPEGYTYTLPGTLTGRVGISGPNGSVSY